MSLPPEKVKKNSEPNFLLLSRYEFTRSIKEEKGGLALILHASDSNKAVQVPIVVRKILKFLQW